jgi:hypothetical protein
MGERKGMAQGLLAEATGTGSSNEQGGTHPQALATDAAAAICFVHVDCLNLSGHGQEVLSARRNAEKDWEAPSASKQTDRAHPMKSFLTIYYNHMHMRLCDHYIV